MDKNVEYIFIFWNSLGLIKHRELERFKSTISGRLKYYTVDEICDAMTSYKEIVLSDDYFFTYRWSLKEWLLRGLDNFLKENDPHERYRSKLAKACETRGNMMDRQREWGSADPKEREILKEKWRKELENGGQESSR